MNVLLIGDFRPAANYGSIATSECLIHMIRGVLRTQDELHIIDRRSFDNETPPAGFPSSYSMHKRQKTKYKRRLKKWLPYFLFNKIETANVSSTEDYCCLYHTPPLFCYFNTYYNEMIKGTRLKFEKDQIEWADIVIINGEGTIVNGIDSNGVYNKGGRYTIFMAWLSKIKFGKPTSLINFTVDPANNDAKEMLCQTLPFLDDICIRDPLSVNLLSSWGIENSKYVPDALFSYSPFCLLNDAKEWIPTPKLLHIIDFSQPYIVLGDSAALNHNAFQDGVRWNVKTTYSRLLKKLREICPQIIFLDGFEGSNDCVNEFVEDNKLSPISLSNCTYHDLFHIFMKSQLFVSGRWHASILALLSYTPILLYGSDSHKTKALYSILDYKYPFFEKDSLPLHIDDLVCSAKKIICDNEIRGLIKNKVDLAKKDSTKNVAFLEKYLIEMYA